jgi:hypothetical protein
MNRKLCGAVSLHNMEVVMEILTAGFMWGITPPSIKFRAPQYKTIRTNSVISPNFTGYKLYVYLCHRLLDLSIPLEYRHMHAVVRKLNPKRKIILPREIVCLCFIQTHNATCLTSLFAYRINDIIN